MPGEQCEQVIAEEPLDVPDFTSCLPPESAEQAAKRQALADAEEEASRLSDEYSRVLGEAVASGNTLADTPEIVAAREAALDATHKELRLQREYLGEGTMKIPSTVCANCGKTFDSDRSMPGVVPGHYSAQDRCPVCARYLDGYKYPDA